jgi:multidrug efflux pump subunit AcrA (membrane-fusion protein)
MKKLLQKAFVLPLIIVLAVALVVFKVKTRPPMAHEEQGFPVRTVEVITARALPFRPRATAYGYVEPAVLLKAKSEVAGKISYIHPDLKKGGSIAQGTVVLRIEPTTFKFSLDQSRAGLASSQSSLQQLETEEKSTRRSLEIAQENLRVGEKELERTRKILEKGLISRSKADAEEQKVLQLRQQVEDLTGKLATYSSRKAAIKAQINQSKTQLAQSQDTLGRTEVIMPFDARIGTVFVEKGEFTGVGNVLFEALGTQAVEINAQLPTRQFRSLLVGLGHGSLNLQNPQGLQAVIKQLQLEATVSLVGYEGSTTWQGELLRIGESVDPTRDTIDLVVLVNNPYEGVIPGKHPPLLKGMYTAVEFAAPAQPMMVLPRKAIHQGRIYLAKSDNLLEIRAVDILHKQGELVVIGGGVKAGEKVIVTDVIPVLEGLPLNPLEAAGYEKLLEEAALQGQMRSLAAGTAQVPDAREMAK